MSGKPLDPSTVAERMIQLRNLEKLYKLSKQRQDLQNKQIATLKRLSTRQQELLDDQMVLIETQAIRIAELEAMVFGKKKKPPIGTPPADQDQSKPTAARKLLGLQICAIYSIV